MGESERTVTTHIHEQPGAPCDECRGLSRAARAKYDPPPSDALADVSYRLRQGAPLTPDQQRMAELYFAARPGTGKHAAKAGAITPNRCALCGARLDLADPTRHDGEAVQLSLGDAR